MGYGALILVTVFAMCIGAGVGGIIAESMSGGKTLKILLPIVFSLFFMVFSFLLYQDEEHEITKEDQIKTSIIEKVQEVMGTDTVTIYEKENEEKYKVLTDEQVLEVKVDKDGDIQSIITGDEVLYVTGK